MSEPILIINLKTYEESEGPKAMHILKICEKIMAKTNKQIAIAPTALSIKDLAENKNKVKIYAQHVDHVDYGSNTGSIVAKELQHINVDGSLINHSEKRLSKDIIEKTILACKESKLETILCVKNPTEAKMYREFKPTYLAVEPPELIGGDISISTAQPEIISQSVVESKNIPLLCGAGVKNAKDVKKSLELGAKGILVASGVVKAANVEEAIMNLIEPF